MQRLFVVVAVLVLAGCASNRPTDTQRLAIIQANAGAPVNQIRNLGAMGWERVDGDHVLLSMRPRETWLLRLSGGCLDWGSGSQVLGLSSRGPLLSVKFDRVLVSGSPVSCRIEEIRPVDAKAVRAAQAAARARAAPGS